MRVECEACHELVEASLAVEGGSVRATCPACHHVTAAAVAASAPADAPACPKCGAALAAEATACPSCGLAAARMAVFSDARDAAVAEPVREAWARAAEAWSEPARHDELFRQVAAHNSYAWAAGRYRTRGRDPIAERQLDRLRRAAEATLLVSATVRPDAAARPYRATIGVLAIMVVAIVVGLAYALVMRDATPATPTAPAAAPQVRPLTPGHPVSPSTIR